MVTDKEEELSSYRLKMAKETYANAKLSFENNFYKDSNNRSYYVIFYAIKAVLALEEVDFKRHKDAVAYFNKTYVATEVFPKSLGKKISKAKIVREAGDYDDFYVFTKEEAKEQLDTASEMLHETERFLGKIKKISKETISEN